MRINTLVIIILTVVSMLSLCTCATKDLSISSKLQDQTKSTASQSSAGTNDSASVVQPALSTLPTRKVYTFKTYTDPTYHCSIDYPEGWLADDSSGIQGDIISSIVSITGPSPDYGNAVIFRVSHPYDSRYMNSLIVNLKNKYKEFILLDNREMQGAWDYYLDYSSIDKPLSELPEMTYRTKIYVKNNKSAAYAIWFTGYRTIYDKFPFSEMAGSFMPGD